MNDTLKPPEPASPPERRTNGQMRLMLLLTVFFVAGVVLFTVFPEESPIRVIIMPLYLTVLIWSLYRFGK